MTDTEKTDVPSGREPAPAEPRNEPDKITDADRAANPLGTARREREREERSRDREGKFARKDGDKDRPDDGKPKPEAKQDGDKPNGEDKGGEQRDGNVPHQALAEERRKRQALERQIAELMQRPPAPAPAPQPQQPQPEPETEFWVDPQGNVRQTVKNEVKSALDPVSQQLQEQREFVSNQFAVLAHGEAAVTEAKNAYAAAFRQSDEATQAREMEHLRRSGDPIGEMVRWHKQQTTMQKYGSDPEAYIKAEVARILAEQNGGERHDPPPAPRQPPQQPLPTSFAAQPGGGPRGAGYGGPKALSEMLPRG